MTVILNTLWGRPNEVGQVVPPVLQTYVFLEPMVANLFGHKVFTGVIKLWILRWDYPVLRGALNPMTDDSERQRETWATVPERKAM